MPCSTLTKRRNREIDKATMQRSARNTQGRTDGDRAQLGYGLNGGGHELLPSLLAGGIGIPNNCETFFWTSMMSSARARRSVKWPFSRLSWRTSSDSEIGRASCRERV